MRCYLLWFALVVTTVLLPTVYLSYLFAPIDGDLTRIGGYSERDFGWNSTQPVIDVEANGKFMTDPDVLVLGDSFSAGNIWQSGLTAKSGKKVLSFHYNQAGCIKNWINYARDHSTARTVVVEAIEREFLKMFIRQPSCKAESPIPIEISATRTVATRKTWPLEWHITHSYRVALNTLEMNLNPNAILQSNIVAARGRVINAPLKAGCAQFSNRRADRLLYLGLDDDKLRWGSEDLARAVSNVAEIQRIFQANGKKFIFVVVPDKLSIYQDCLAEDKLGEARKKVNVIDRLIASGVNSPNLIKEFRARANTIVDLYYPNNTHLSESGYLLMAKELDRFIATKSFSHEVQK